MGRSWLTLRGYCKSWYFSQAVKRCCTVRGSPNKCHARLSQTIPEITTIQEASANPESLRAVYYSRSLTPFFQLLKVVIRKHFLLPAILNQDWHSFPTCQSLHTITVHCPLPTDCWYVTTAILNSSVMTACHRHSNITTPLKWKFICKPGDKGVITSGKKWQQTTKEKLEERVKPIKTIKPIVHMKNIRTQYHKTNKTIIRTMHKGGCNVACQQAGCHWCWSKSCLTEYMITLHSYFSQSWQWLILP